MSLDCQSEVTWGPPWVACPRLLKPSGRNCFLPFSFNKKKRQCRWSCCLCCVGRESNCKHCTLLDLWSRKALGAVEELGSSWLVPGWQHFQITPLLMCPAPLPALLSKAQPNAAARARLLARTARITADDGKAEQRSWLPSQYICLVDKEDVFRAVSWLLSLLSSNHLTLHF